MSCAHCGKPGAAKGCSACKTTRYCDEDCQRAHWAVHKGPCKETQRAAALASAAPTPPPPPLALTEKLEEGVEVPLALGLREITPVRVPSRGKLPLIEAEERGEAVSWPSRDSGRIKINKKRSGVRIAMTD